MKGEKAKPACDAGTINKEKERKKMEVILSKQCESLVGMLESEKGPSGLFFLYAVPSARPFPYGVGSLRS